MKPEALLQKLEAAASSLDVKVSYESIAANVGPGGLCRVKGKYRVIIEKRTTPAERVGVLAAALARVIPNCEGAELEPAVLDACDYYAMPRAS